MDLSTRLLLLNRRTKIQRPIENLNAYQEVYTSLSSLQDEAVMCPRSMKEPMREAMERVRGEVGDLDEFVARELEYPSVKEMQSYFMGLQVDAIALAIWQIRKKNALINSDQTGVGKGRVASAVCRWTIIHGLLPIFVTYSDTLFTDFQRDLDDIGFGPSVWPLLFNAGASITEQATGRKIFGNKSSMKGVLTRISETGELPRARNAVYLTYSQINTINVQQEALSRLAPKAVFILDESHNAGGDESNTGAFFQEVLPAAHGVMFLSATWAKCPDNMTLYATKTDISIAIPDNQRVSDAIRAGGPPLQTVVSHQLAQTGQLVRRERSFEGISILNFIDDRNQFYQEQVCDDVTEVLRAIFKADQDYHQNDFETLRLQYKKRRIKIYHHKFSAIVHNIVKQFLLALKSDAAADCAIEALGRGEKPIIALESTMGAFLDSYVSADNLSEGEVLDKLSWSTILRRALDRTLHYTVKTSKGNDRREFQRHRLYVETEAKYREAERLLDALAVTLPVSPIDWIRTRITQAGFTVAEITGRSYRINYAGPVPVLSSVPASERKDRLQTGSLFNNGGVDCLVLNQAGSTGISLHASEKFKDQHQRHMIVAQPAGDVAVFCLDAQTEVLTPDGFRSKNESFDLVAGFDERTGEISWQPVTARIERPLADDEFMVGISSPSLDIRVTNRHHMILKDRHNFDEWRKEEAQDAARLTSMWKIPVSGFQSVPAPMELTNDELRFIGWYLTDGTIGKSNHALFIWQSEHQPFHDAIRSCIEGCGFRYSVYRSKAKTQFNQTSDRLCYYVGRYQYARLNPYLNKDFPLEFEQLHRDQLWVLLEAIHMGDGAKQPKNVDWIQRSWHISTGNKTYADRLQSLCVRRGFRASISERHCNEKPLYIINIKNQRENAIAPAGCSDGRQLFKVLPSESGESVWCVENPLGTLITRRNGKVAILGNCQMLGRSNRTGQMVLPRYTMLSLAIPAEIRPAISLAKKLKSLNANTSSNTRSPMSIEAPDMMNKYGDKIVAEWLHENEQIARLMGLTMDKSEEEGGTPEEDLARTATGRSALLPVKEQREFMEMITESYTDYIAYLDETGQNDLEPKTYDFDAEQKTSHVIYVGSAPSSPFGEDAIFGTYSIKRQGKSYTPAEVEELIAQTYGPDLMKYEPWQRDTYHARALSAHLEGLFKPYIASVEAPHIIERAERIREWSRTILNDFRMGTGLRIEINGDTYNGIIYDIRGRKKVSGNPYAPSSLKFYIAVNGPLREVRVPGSQIKKITLSNLGRNANIAELFQDYLSDTRQRAKVITGNLLGAYGQLKPGSKGRIITFTKHEGGTEQGILMPAKFDWEHDVTPQKLD